MKYQMISLYSFIILNISTLYIIGNSEVPGPKDFTHSPYDLTLVGEVRFAGSIRRLPIAIAELFKDDATINHIPTSDLVDLKDVSKEAAAIFQNPDKTPGNVALIFEGLWNYGRHSFCGAAISSIGKKKAISPVTFMNSPSRMRSSFLIFL